MQTADPAPSPEFVFQASCQREIIDRLVHHYDQHLRRILRLREVVKGSVCQIATRCGNHSCHCAQPLGRLHPATVLTWSEQGKRHIRSLAPGDRDRVRTLADNYRCLRSSRSSLNKLHREILQAIDRLEEAIRVPAPPPVRVPREVTRKSIAMPGGPRGSAPRSGRKHESTGNL